MTAASEQHGASTAESSPLTGTGSILVVEDDPQVLRLGGGEEALLFGKAMPRAGVARRRLSFPGIDQPDGHRLPGRRLPSRKPTPSARKAG